MSGHPHPHPMFPGPPSRENSESLSAFPSWPQRSPPTDGTRHAAVWSSLALSHIPHQPSDYLGGPGSSPGSLANCWCLAPWQPPKLPHVWECAGKVRRQGWAQQVGALGIHRRARRSSRGFQATRQQDRQAVTPSYGNGAICSLSPCTSAQGSCRSGEAVRLDLPGRRRSGLSGVA